jgi:hypothetical protein
MKVTVLNPTIGAVREATSSADGSAAISALSLTGTCSINVTKAGFVAEDVNDFAAWRRRNRHGERQNSSPATGGLS